MPPFDLHPLSAFLLHTGHNWHRPKLWLLLALEIRPQTFLHQSIRYKDLLLTVQLRHRHLHQNQGVRMLVQFLYQTDKFQTLLIVEVQKIHTPEVHLILPPKDYTNLVVIVIEVEKESQHN